MAKSFENIPFIVLRINQKIEYFAIFIFTMEFIGRFITADYLYPPLEAIKYHKKKYLFFSLHYRLIRHIAFLNSNINN
jgi:hypothetical protein